MFDWHKCKSFFISNFEVGEPSILPRKLSGSVIGPQTCCPDDLTDDEERVNYQVQNRTQELFERILGWFNPAKTVEPAESNAFRSAASWWPTARCVPKSEERAT